MKLLIELGNRERGRRITNVLCFFTNEIGKQKNCVLDVGWVERSAIQHPEICWVTQSLHYNFLQHFSLATLLRVFQKSNRSPIYCVQTNNYMRVHLYQVSLITYNSCYSPPKATLLLPSEQAKRG